MSTENKISLETESDSPVAHQRLVRTINANCNLCGQLIKTEADIGEGFCNKKTWPETIYTCKKCSPPLPDEQAIAKLIWDMQHRDEESIAYYGVGAPNAKNRPNDDSTTEKH